MTEKFRGTFAGKFADNIAGKIAGQPTGESAGQPAAKLAGNFAGKLAGAFNGRIRRGVTGTAAAAAAMAALTASQAPSPVARISTPPVTTSPDLSISGDTPYHTELPPLAPHNPSGPSAGLHPTGSIAAGGGAIPATVLDAYKKAAAALAKSAPGCNLPWQLLAAIGQVESGQARGGRVNAGGTTHSPILGPQLNGAGFATIRDTDNGAYDGDSAYDRAVGPMQFIPSTWATWGADGNGDGRADPNNIYDAALAAGRYLCAGGRDLSDPYDLDRAILGYNRSQEYLRTVKSWLAYFNNGHSEVPDRKDTTPHPKPEPAGTPRPEPSPSVSPARPSRPSPDARKSSSPTPSPTQSRGSGGEAEPEAPALPLPSAGIELPGDDVLPGSTPLTRKDG
jgi:hypothetical protein